MWKTLANYRDTALLIFRIAFGSFFIYTHGWPKLAGGVVKWKAIGAAAKHIGIDFLPAVWGFLAAFSESIGCVLLILGLFFRPACALLLCTMIVASAMLLDKAGAWSERFGAASHPIELAMLLALLVFIGPGRFSIDKG